MDVPTLFPRTGLPGTHDTAPMPGAHEHCGFWRGHVAAGEIGILEWHPAAVSIQEVRRSDLKKPPTLNGYVR